MPIPFRPSNRRQSLIGISLSLIALMGVLGGCNNRNRTADKLAQDSKQVQDFDNSLTFNAVTLEEFDNKGRLWWQVKANQASYSKDKKIARVKQPTGKFFQDGKAILQVSAKDGEVQQDGQKIFLRGQITAKDLRDGLLLRGNELEWQPRNDLLIVRNNMTGSHRQVNVFAREGRFLSRARRLDLEGQVTATASDPALQFKSERVTWLIKQQTLSSDRPLQIDRYQNKAVTDRATANQGTVDLKAKIATLKQNADVTFTNPPVQISSNQLTWNPNQQLVTSEQPVTVVNRQQQVTLTANQGRMNLKTNTVQMTGNVRGVGERNQARVNSDRLNWNLTTQQFQADGNVVYQQATPPLNLSGPRAAGRLQDQNVVVSGGRVETQFIP